MTKSVNQGRVRMLLQYYLLYLETDWTQIDVLELFTG